MPIRTELAIGTYGTASSIRRPARNSGCWGPGTFVVTVLRLRCGTRNAARIAEGEQQRGREPAERGQHLPRHRLLERLRPSICAFTACSRSTGSSMPTGSSANIAETRLL